jgi:hypothetical protein
MISILIQLNLLEIDINNDELLKKYVKTKEEEKNI